ncbi:MAG: asparagine synthase (glutamine-hydrolyzing) [Microscillaceae bacterium]
MCGITGIYAYNEIGRFHSIQLKNAVDSLGKRGPDFADMSLHHFVNLGHTRLSILDLSRGAHQPMKDESGRYTLVFNGEIYNFNELREKLEAAGYAFRSTGDTEVLFKGLMHWGTEVLAQLNGFFAFAWYDEEEKTLLLARDRFGIKPLLIYEDEDKLLFGSEMKALLEFGIDKSLDYVGLYQYLQFNYIPGPGTIFEKVRHLRPGHWLRIKGREKTEAAFYQIAPPGTGGEIPASYEAQKERLVALIDASVRKRLIADVPLGAFLSGGIDSSVITALAARHTDKLHTFSIGYRDEPFFDETRYARLVAQKFNTEHTVFSLSNADLYEHLFEVLDYIDQPFADSSALAVYILSKRTRQKVKVALSGDGADELFSGYNKHRAEWNARSGGWKAQLLARLLPLWKALPKSRQGFLSNKIRQFQRFVEGQKLGASERYWRWAALAPEGQAWALLSPTSQAALSQPAYETQKAQCLQNLRDYPPGPEAQSHFGEVLKTDLQLVLPYDMLTKVDLMSMANGLEVRVPFLDHEVVNFVNALPVASKINGQMRKRILQDAFRSTLPPELYRRSKHGFEVPLLKWLRGDLRRTIEQDWLGAEFVKSQGIFDYKAIAALKAKLFSSNPEDVHARIWGLVVFQHWWKKWH